MGSVVRLGIRPIGAGNIAQLGAVGRRRVTVLRRPEPVDARVVSILLVESLVASVALRVQGRGGVAGLSRSVTTFGRAVSGVRRVDQLPQPLFAAFQLGPQLLVGGLSLDPCVVARIGDTLPLIGGCVALVEQCLAGFQQGFPSLGKGLFVILGRRHQPGSRSVCSSMVTPA